MSKVLQRSDFQPHQDSTFAVEWEDGTLDLELVTIDDLDSSAEGAEAREHQFSLLFAGPAEPVLRQQTVEMTHATLGTIAVFLVPVQHAEEGTQYEAVFNRSPEAYS